MHKKKDQGFFPLKYRFFMEDSFFPLKERGFLFNRRRGFTAPDEELGSNICGKYTGSEKYLRINIIRKHGIIRRLKCGHCGKSG